MILAFLAFLAVQDPSALVEQLRSDDLETRDAAYERLKTIGLPALAAVERVATDSDPEVSDRARRLARVIPIRQKLPPRLMAEYPDIDERLASGDDHAWTEVALEFATGKLNPKGLVRADVASMVREALRHARTGQERAGMCDLVFRWSLTSVAADTLDIVRPDEPNVRDKVNEILRELRPRDALTNLRRMVKSDDFQERVRAVEMLGRLRTRDAVGDLIGALTDPDRSVRAHAQLALREAPPSDAVEDIAALLKHELPDARSSAADILGRWGVTACAPRIRPLLRDDDKQVRAFAARSLAQLKDEAAISELRPLLRDGDENVREQAVRALVDLKDKASALAILEVADAIAEERTRCRLIGELGVLESAEIVPALLVLVDEGSEEIREAAIGALAGYGSPEAFLALLERIERGEDRKALLHALEDFSTDRVLPLVLPLLESPDIDKAHLAIKLLGGSKSPEVAAACVEALRHPNSAVRSHAAQFLGSWEHSSAVPALVALLDDPEPDVRRDAVQSLAKLKARDAVPSIASLAREGPEAVRFAALDALADLYAGRAVPDIAACLAHASPAIRSKAVEALVDLDARDRLPDILALAKDGDPAVQVVVLKASSRFRTPETRRVVMDALDGDHREVLMAAMRAAGDLYMREAAPRVADLLSGAGADSILKIVALETLVALKARDRVDAVARLLNDKDENVVNHAIRTLGLLRAPESVPILLDVVRRRTGSPRAMAIQQLGDLRLKEAVDTILPHLDDLDRDVRSRAVVALAKILKGEATPHLLKLLAGDDLALRADALTWLQQVGTPAAADAVTPFLSDERLCWRAAATLAAFGAKRHAPAIVPLLDDPAPETRKTAVESLVKLGYAEAGVKFAALIQDPDHSVRQAALQAVRQLRLTGALPQVEASLADPEIDPTETLQVFAALRGKEAIPVIVKFIHHESSSARYFAMRLLVESSAPEISPEVEALFKDPDPSIRHGLIGSLRRLRVKAAEPRLIEFLADPDDDVRESAAFALGSIDATDAIPDLLRAADDRNEELVMAAGCSLIRLAPEKGIPVVERLLGSDNPSRRSFAATLLCRAGVRSGVRYVLDHAGRQTRFFALNALRRPDVWKRLSAVKWSHGLSGACGDMMDRLAKDAGLPWAIEDPEIPGDPPWLKLQAWPHDNAGKDKLLEAIEDLVGDLYSPYEAIIESDRIRLVPRDDALAFWENWWEKDK